MRGPDPAIIRQDRPVEFTGRPFRSTERDRKLLVLLVERWVGMVFGYDEAELKLVASGLSVVG